VIDIGSVKGAISKQFESHTDGFLEFVATHPMAGKEKNGFENSDPNLFNGASWIVTPHARNTVEALNKVESLILTLGAQPFRMDPQDHDRKAALISHMPYLVSKALLAFVSAKDPAALMMGGPGFRSMTRLAYDNPEMWRDITQNNKENMARSLEEFAAFLREAT
jgi:prephenate dehydrogenase